MNKISSADTYNKFLFLTLLYNIYDIETNMISKTSNLLKEMNTLKNLDELDNIEILYHHAYFYFKINDVEKLRQILLKLEDSKLINLIESNRCLSELYSKIDKKKSKLYLDRALENYNKEKYNLNSKKILLDYLFDYYKLNNDLRYLKILENKIIYNKTLSKSDIQKISIKVLKEYIESKNLDGITKISNYV